KKSRSMPPNIIVLYCTDSPTPCQRFPTGNAPKKHLIFYDRLFSDVSGNLLISPFPRIVVQGAPTLLDYLCNCARWYLSGLLTGVTCGGIFAILRFHIRLKSDARIYDIGKADKLALLSTLCRCFLANLQVYLKA